MKVQSHLLQQTKSVAQTTRYTPTTEKPKHLNQSHLSAWFYLVLNALCSKTKLLNQHQRRRGKLWRAVKVRKVLERGVRNEISFVRSILRHLSFKISNLATLTFYSAKSQRSIMKINCSLQFCDITLHHRSQFREGWLNKTILAGSRFEFPECRLEAAPFLLSVLVKSK